MEFKGEDEQYYFVVIDKSGNQMFTPIKSGGNTVGIIRYNRFSVIKIISVLKRYLMNTEMRLQRSNRVAKAVRHMKAAC